MDTPREIFASGCTDVAINLASSKFLYADHETIRLKYS
jgi:hypothetical protein